MTVSGRVISNGFPVDNAIVHDFHNAVTTGPDGQFSLETDQGFISVECIGYFPISLQAVPYIEIELDQNPDNTALQVVEVQGKLIKKKNLNWLWILLALIVVIYLMWKYKWIS